MKKKLILIGAGGHCKVIIDSLKDHSEFEIEGIIDCPEKIGQSVLGIPIVGSDDDLERIYNQGVQYAFIAIGSIRYPNKRIEIFNLLLRIGYQIPNIIDSTAIIAKSVKMGKGNYFGKGAIVNADVNIKDACIINTGSIIEHDGYIDNFVHIAPRATLCGNVSVGEKTHIGCSATVIQDIRIGKECIIGAGSVVIRNIPEKVQVCGVPAKIKQN